MNSSSIRVDNDFRNYLKRVREEAEKKTVIPLTDTGLSKALAKFLNDTGEFEKYFFGNKIRKGKRRNNGGLFLI